MTLNQETISAPYMTILFIYASAVVFDGISRVSFNVLDRQVNVFIYRDGWSNIACGL